jgi:hypothetical protein
MLKAIRTFARVYQLASTHWPRNMKADALQLYVTAESSMRIWQKCWERNDHYG